MIVMFLTHGHRDRFEEATLRMLRNNKTFLCENGRPDDKIWRKEHAEAVQKRFAALSPGTQIQIPQPGEIITLT